MDNTTPGQRRPARASLAAATASVLVLAVFAGLKTFGLLAVGLAGTVMTVAAVWWLLTRRGPSRLFAALLAVGAPVWVVVSYTSAHLAWVVAVASALWVPALGAGRSALVRADAPLRPTEHPAPPVGHAVLIMNPRSGGGKVERFALREKAESLGARVLLLEGPGETDVSELARKAAAEGADLLGVAGGDGTQALVADVAASLGVPFLVIPAGTRNHFALDLGLDREDPAKALDALRDGVELRVDLGRAGVRPFVNNVSFGAYAEVVQSPAYRGEKTGLLLTSRACGAVKRVSPATAVRVAPLWPRSRSGRSSRVVQGPRCHRCRKRRPGRRTAPGHPRHRPDPCNGHRGGRRRGPPLDPGRPRRRGPDAPRPRTLHDPSPRTTSPGATPPPGDAHAEAPARVGTGCPDGVAGGAWWAG
ncbi:acylglycerol kinase family protein [Streptomyces sp. HGB0020]|uniref:acylglycerol kinase family protein n=1 Tax=Streptomyces sp. HGB0020 TaxID=1078086 RepID=UPI00034E7E32|nr:acylglycerol kinase family protein [Streptomyces sp. HGB0020]EPD62446.1 hypothetical protein HMPREF1211_04080 [Streptomyces sp. HGB0020]